jgi:hypothetical protein
VAILAAAAIYIYLWLLDQFDRGVLGRAFEIVDDALV